MDAQQSPDVAAEFGLFDQPLNTRNLAANYDAATSKHELLAIFAAEKQQYAHELAAKFKSVGTQQIKEYEQKIKQKLKDKYEQVARSLLKEREQQLINQYQQKTNQYQEKIADLQVQVNRLEQDLAKQQQGVHTSFEKEQATRTLYEDLIKASRSEFMQQAEHKFRAEYIAKELELKQAHAQQLIQREQKLAAEYTVRQQTALLAQEQTLTSKYTAQIEQQNELFNLKLQQQIDAGTVLAIQSQRSEFEQERAALQAMVEGMRPEVAANKQRWYAEVTEQVRQEYEQKFIEFKAAQEQEVAALKAAQEHEFAVAKAELTQRNHGELELLIAGQRQKLAEEIHQENSIVMKYKEREIRDACDAQVLQATLDLKQRNAQEVQEAVQEALAQQALQLQVDYNKKLAENTAKLTVEHEEKIKLATIQERARLSQITTNEKKLLLEQQLANLEKEHQNALLTLETRLLQGQDPRIQNVIDKIVAERVIELRRQMEASRPTSTPVPHLQSEINQQLQVEALAQCEQRLRQEYQVILENQRKQAAENFASHLKQAVRRALTKYKQRLSTQMSASREEELAILEDQLKAQYAHKLQQQVQALKMEFAKDQGQFIAAEESKIKLHVEQQTAELRRQHKLELQKAIQEQEHKFNALLEQERQKFNMKFVQDKANLIKDLTARFTHEKQVAMQKYETELRDKLYKEMVKQKDYIQAKFSGSQDVALQDLKRRLDAQHKQEIDRIKQGYFDPFAKRNQDTEQLADRILAKFQVSRED